jgi:hypothetical protein
MPEGGPVGEGALRRDRLRRLRNLGRRADAESCPFGVVREGSGNAGVWIALGDGVERQILFEAGAPVATNRDGALTSERSGDTTLVRIGEERYEIPDAHRERRLTYATDRLVCADPGLRALDAELERLWARAEAAGRVAVSVQRAQADWFRQRSLCAFRDDHRGCVEGAYRARIAELRRIADG